MGWAGALAQAARRAAARFTERRTVRKGPSAIDGAGLFVVRRVVAGEELGQLRLGPPGPQGKHTLLVGAQHRSVARPWRFLNHSCTPSARLRFSPPSVTLIAARDLPAHSELTIDYAALPEEVSVAFACRCGRCERAARIGGANGSAPAAQREPVA
jgi:hypothetical protein